MGGDYLLLSDLKPYRLAVEFGRICWQIYETMSWGERKIIGDQFITAADSIGANIAEGYGRFHYLDRIKFYYNARGSILETKHWLLLLRDRQKLDNLTQYHQLSEQINALHKQLNIYIKYCYPKKVNI